MYNQSDYSGININELVSMYEHAAALHGDATITGKYKVTHTTMSIIVAIEKELYVRNEQLQLKPLLKSENLSARVEAARYLLAFVPKEAEKVLEDAISNEPNPVLIVVEANLRIWRAGKWKTPDYMQEGGEKK